MLIIYFSGLTRTITLNTRMAPHVVDFMYAHFKKFFNVDPTFAIDLKPLIGYSGEDLVVQDNIGLLTKLMVYCVQFAPSPSAVIISLDDLIRKISESINDISLDSIGVRQRKKIFDPHKNFFPSGFWFSK